MALGGQEQQLIGPGIQQNNPELSSFALNMIYHQGNWKVRKGFGQVGEWTSTLSRYTLNPGNLVETEGYRYHLGSHMMTTDFGHKQIISLFLLEAWNSNAIPGAQASTLDSIARRGDLYSVSIYDMTTGDRWEEIIHEATADRESTVQPLPTWHGYYESTYEEQYAAVIPANSNNQAFFVEFRDYLFFGNDASPILFYKPCAFKGNRDRGLDPTIGKEATVYSENTVISKLYLAPGSFPETRTYRTFLPKINTISVLGDRLVYCADYELHFSDIGRPGAVENGHSLVIPSQNPIVAAQEISGNLLIWSKTETFLYQPNRGFERANGGQLTKISDSVGCLSPASVTKFLNAVAWVDKEGVYVNAGGMGIDNIAIPIKPFFDNFLSNPLSHYELEEGRTDLTLDQPKIEYNLNPENVSIVYSADLRALLVTVPEQRCTLVMGDNKEWSMWIYDSAAIHTGLRAEYINIVGVHELMDCQQLVTDGIDIYSIGQDSSGITTDYAATWNLGANSWLENIDKNQKFKSYFICKYGLGGGCDRNVADEDYRYGIGNWRYSGTSVTNPPLVAYPGFNTVGQSFKTFIGQPQKVEPGFVVDNVTMANGGVLVPIQVEFDNNDWNSGFNNITNIEIQFEFDRSHWKPVFGLTMTNNINFIEKTPLENLQGGMGNTTANFTMVRWRQAQTYNRDSGALDVSETGGVMRIGWNMTDAAAAGTTFGTQHFIKQTLAGAITPTIKAPFPAPRGRKVTLCWIPFEPIIKVPYVPPAYAWQTIRATSEMGIRGVNAVAYYDNVAVTTPPGGANYYLSENYVWDFSSLGQIIDNAFGWFTPLVPGLSNALSAFTDVHGADTTAQGVDWAYLSPPIGIDQGEQIKSRGAYTQLKSTGVAVEGIDNGWSNETGTIHGQLSNGRRVYNSLVTSDQTAWQGQISDFEGPPILQGLLGKKLDATKINEDPVLGDQQGPPPVVVVPTLEGPGGEYVHPTYPMSGPIAFHNSPPQNTLIASIQIADNILGTPSLMDQKIFGKGTWGDATDATKGTVLNDNTQYNTIASGASTKGQWARWMFFGYILDKAEKLSIKSAKTIIRKVGGRRRTGQGTPSSISTLG